MILWLDEGDKNVMDE